MGRSGVREEVGRVAKWFGFWFPFLITISFPLFYFKSNPNYLNSNLNLNSTLALKQIKQCTSMNATTKLNLRKFLITSGTKIRLNASLKTINLRNLNKAN